MSFSLVLTPAAPALKVNTTLALTAKGKDSTGKLVLLSANGGSENVTWTTDAPGVVGVTGDGAAVTLAGVGKGSTTVHASLHTDAGATLTTTASVSVTGADGTVNIK